MNKKHINRLLSMLLAVAVMFGILAVPASAASLKDSGSVTIQQAGYGNYLSISTGGTVGGGYWKYTSNNGTTGTAYCVNHGLKGVSPSKSLTVQEYNREPKTMGAFANGYPNRTLAQFKELHQDDVRGVSGLTEDEYKYATQLAVWATCGQLAVPGTSFTAGREKLIAPTSDAQKIRIFDSVKAILTLANGWTKHIYTGMYLRAEENRDVRGVEVVHERGLEGAAQANREGIRKETINGKEYYTRVMYVASATSTWIDDHKTKVYSTDAPAGTIFVAENNSPLETVQENGATCYKVDTSTQRSTNLNANGSEYCGAFKVCIPVDNVMDEGSFTIKATGGVAQFNLYLAYNPAASEQSYIISDPGYTTCDAQATFKWKSTEELEETASLQVVKAGAGGAPLEGAEFTLTGDKGTTVTGTTDRNGQIIWTDLPADEKFTLAETAAPEGYQVIAPMNVTLTPGRTEYLTITDDVERGFTIKKVDAQNKGSLQGAVFRFEQIDGSYTTTGITGFDGTISFEEDELPYGSYRITEQSPPDGYVKSSRVETVEWDGTKDVLITWENVRDISLTIVKVDEQTGVSLPNATFDVYADGKLITSVTTNDDGVARVTGIRKEAYIEIVETAAPAGYVLDKTPHGIHIDPYDPATEDDPVLTVTNRARPALRILKYDLTSNKPMPDVTFEVWHDGDLFGEYTTNASGEIFLYDLDPGTYLVKEIATDDEHVVNSTPQQIELKAGDTQTRELVFFNSLKPGIHLIKVDSITMKSLPNVRFEFKLVGGSYRQEFTTDINGEIDLSKLTPGAYE
ncbi:MAG: Cys-Gln thioester bond-forming surface protein, partial [Oscillospiraceae bacterium]|nr:Cys-Gln thioester bond-forming surface protein [Oscillospiraceae bacterium]